MSDGKTIRRMTSWAIGAVSAAALTTALAQPKSVETEAGSIELETLVSGLNHPWGMTFLPDGRLLVTERAGTLQILDLDDDNGLSGPIQGVPDVFAEGQGGLLDVALDPDFESNRLIYLSYAEPGEGGASTALGRGRLEGDALQDFEVLFRQEPKVSGPNHFGGRIAFAPDGKVFLAMGERFKFEPAQDLSNHIGTIVRLNPDGSVPEDNPFVGRADARDEIWSYGHRNIESAAIHPETGELWVAEMGPLGGDELNRPEAGKNYGWPLVSWGKHYNGEDIPDPSTRPEFADAVTQWTPGIAPSGMIFYTGDVYSEWRGSALIGGLVSEGLVRVTIENGEVTGEERIPLEDRIRDVEQGPDGLIYVTIDEDNGSIVRLKPLE